MMSTSPLIKLAEVTLTGPESNELEPLQRMSALSPVYPLESKESSEEIGRTKSHMKEIFPLYVSTVALASVRTIARCVENDSDVESESSDDSDDEVVDSDDEVVDKGLNNDEDRCCITTAAADKSIESTESGISVSTNKLSLQMDKLNQIEEHDYDALVGAGVMLNSAISACNGNTTVLMKRLEESYKQKEFRVDVILRVIADNIAACNRAGYVNKEKLFHHIRTFMEQLDAVSTPETQPINGKVITNNGKIDNESDDSGHDGKSGVNGHSNSLLHAPEVMDADISQRDIHESTRSIEAPQSFIDGLFTLSKKNGSSSSVAAVRNKKKKGVKRAALRIEREIADKIGCHLTEHGWSVCDSFLSDDLVRRVRLEADLFKSHYEQSEIWIGKDADVGAHLSIKSVRGDKVLWMCGAHQQAPDKIGRIVETIGEIEPCNLQLKALAPLRRFQAMRELVAACDQLMENLKSRVGRLKGIYQRSDAMLANYPAGGSRFARHIDNTTSDGRRLTMLIYLNPDWSVSLGGALRLTPLTGDAVDVYPQGGRLALFYSADCPHEVMPTYGDRHAITIWYYDREERQAAVDRSRGLGRSAGVARSNPTAQRDAKIFIARLMGGDEVSEDGGEPTQEELRGLAESVRNMDDECVSIVSSITGAKSVQAFREGFGMLSVQDLKNMRMLTRRMGLD